MEKIAKFTYNGMKRGVAKSKHPFQFYYEGNNIRIISTDTQSTGVISNEKGNEFILEIPSPMIDLVNTKINYNDKELFFTTDEFNNIPTQSGDQVIIGQEVTRNSIILITTDNNGFDCIWEVQNILESNFDLKLLYCRNLGLSVNNPIQVLFNYENEKIQKIYWVDGINQIRFLNIKHSIENGDLEELIDLGSNTINFVGNVELNQPFISEIKDGGTHTSGMIQYAYVLYKLNGSQTTLSPLTELIALDKGDGLGGGDLNEIVGKIPVIRVNNIDSQYTHIKLYAIKYTSFGEIPKVSLLVEREIGSTNTIEYFDDGNVINDISLAEFIFLGSNPIKPRHIQSKDNRLFYSDIKEENFNIELDMRAFSFPFNSTTTYILDDVKSINGNLPIPESVPKVGGTTLLVDNTYNVSEKFDAVNPNYNHYKFQYNSNKLGGEGKYIKYELDQERIDFNDIGKSFFKDGEIYRMAIQFYNNLGQKSEPIWIADIKSLRGMLNNTVTRFKVEFKSEFFVWLNDNSNFENEEDKPVGYRILRAEREFKDRTILYQGTLTGMMYQVKGEEAQNFSQFDNISRREDFQDAESLKFPSYATRSFGNTHLFNQGGLKFLAATKHNSWVNDRRADAAEIHTVAATGSKSSQTFQFTKMMQLYSPDIEFNDFKTRNGLKLNIVAAIDRTFEGFEAREVFYNFDSPKNNGKYRSFPNTAILEDNNISAVLRTPKGYEGRFIGPSGDENTTDNLQFYKNFSSVTQYNNFPENNIYDIYGTPEVTDYGSPRKNYNNDPRYPYSNTLKSWLSDAEDDCDQCPAIISINSLGAKCITLMLGNASDETNNRLGLEDLYSEFFNNNSSITDKYTLIGELTIPNEDIYLSNIYGGNTFESKKRNSYIEIGRYRTGFGGLTVDHPGDTFIGNYKTLRISKDDNSNDSNQIIQITDILEYKTESSIDLSRRNDLSLFGWDNEFQPSIEDYSNYNKVYSQQSNLIQNQSVDFTFKKIEEFDTRIIASKVKTPGENIDSWTDYLVNDTEDLDGKYGPINALINYNDEIFALQDTAVAHIIINPRVQTQSNDGIAIELGRGDVLYDYRYITTKSGTINKWSVLNTDTGFYYLDGINKSFNKYQGNSIINMSVFKDMNVFFINSIFYIFIEQVNHL